jgi:hypothetical protein
MAGEKVNSKGEWMVDVLVATQAVQMAKRWDAWKAEMRGRQWAV